MPKANRTSSAHQAGAWAYNQDNQLVQYPELKNSQALPTQVAYTPTGHTAGETNSQGTKTYRYNAAERLVEVSQSTTNGTTTTTYRYDPFGRRISKTHTQGASTSTTYFVYNDTGLMAELNAQGQMTKAYGFNPQAAQAGLWSTDPMWQAEVSNSNLKDPATQTHYLHTDHLGTPMLATDRTGQATWKGISEAFGLTRVDNASSITMNLRFPGQYWDQETQTHYNYFRDYRPNTGRYAQSDPIGLVGGINLFAYVDVNPLISDDPLGLQAGRGLPIPRPPSVIGSPDSAGRDGYGNDSGQRDRYVDRGRGNDCVLYHILDCVGDIVYIGITQQDPRARENQHRGGVDGKIRIWECELCKFKYVQVASYPDRTACEIAEGREIAFYRPFINDRKNPDDWTTRYGKYRNWYNQRCIPCQ